MAGVAAETVAEELETGFAAPAPPLRPLYYLLKRLRLGLGPLIGMREPTPLPSLALPTKTVIVHKSWQADLAIALACMAGLLALAVATGFPKLADSAGDNDSLMRLVEVRDLLAGQGWFDLAQYRMGLPGGFVMHWSRLVDAPIAGLVLLGQALSGSRSGGEAFALSAWPLLLAGATMFLLLRIVRRIAGEAALLPAAVIGTAALHYTGQFMPGSIDHHNVQIVLMLATILLLVEAPRVRAAAAGAGAAAALMPAIGMETMPYVASAGLCVAVGWWWGGSAERRTARHFGLAFAAVSLAALVTTVAPSRWLSVQCDAFSGGQAGAALLAGLGLAGAVSVHAGSRSRAGRAAGLAIVGAALVLFAWAFLPQCLGDPYAGLDPRLQRFWLGSVTEAQSFLSLAVNQPQMLAGYYATPLLGLGLLAAGFARLRLSRGEITVAVFLAAAVTVSLWQVRGAMFSMPLAAIPLSAWVMRRRVDARDLPSGEATLKMAAAWLLSFSVVWASATAFVGVRLGAPAPIADAADGCYADADYAALAALPPATVLAVSNLGPAVLANSPHRVLAGPYHRNVAGDLAALNAWMGSPEEAEQVVRRQGVTLVAHCPGNPETAALAEWAPGGLAAALDAGRVPAWLTPVPGLADAPLRLYRIAAAQGR